MYLKILLNYLIGYVHIEVEGYFIERFINLCISKHILLWNSKREKSTLLHTNMSIHDFRRISTIAKQAKCKVKIQAKKGLPFIFHKYKKRKLFFVFLLFIFIGIMSLSNFVWNIEITGNTTIPTEELLQTVQEEGLTVGKLKGKINSKEIINKIRLDRNDIAWVGIELQGTNAVVKVVEADKKPEIINEEEYCNIVATKPGIIVKIDALNGTPLVKEGDTIKAGTVLIGGFLEGKYTGTRYVHANGQVQAKVWYSQTEKVELKQMQKIRTGNVETKYSVNLNNFPINLYKTLSKFEKYDTIMENNKLKLFSDFYLPIEVSKITNYEVKEEPIEYSIEEAKQLAQQKAKEILDGQIAKKENILNTYINYKQTDNVIEAEVIYEVLEEIGTKEKIVF
ncbi:MAG: sporulation protein YqfD [Clostridia bacterium]